LFKYIHPYKPVAWDGIMKTRVAHKQNCCGGCKDDRPLSSPIKTQSVLPLPCMPHAMNASLWLWCRLVRRPALITELLRTFRPDCYSSIQWRRSEDQGGACIAVSVQTTPDSPRNLGSSGFMFARSSINSHTYKPEEEELRGRFGTDQTWPAKKHRAANRAA
jgi:hypothetical protein